MTCGKPVKKEGWPCGYCHKNCNSSCVYCDFCEKWFHGTCQNLDRGEIRNLGKIVEGYICLTCRSDENGKFDFLMGLSRLNKAAKGGFENLKAVVERESMISKDMISITHRQPEDLKVDEISEHIRGRNTTDYRHIAVTSTPDGDCLFNSISTLLTGNENMSVELRYRTCLELILNSDHILQHPSRAAFDLLSPTYVNVCIDCAQLGGYSSVWTIVALANVIQTPIRSIYPCMNGSKDLAFVKFNVLFQPTSSTEQFPEVNIMWTNTLETQHSMWTPNHFVPLVDPACVTQVSEKSFIKGKTGPESTPLPPTKRSRSPKLPDDNRSFHFKKARTHSPDPEQNKLFASPNTFSVLHVDGEESDYVTNGDENCITDKKLSKGDDHNPYTHNDRDKSQNTQEESHCDNISDNPAEAANYPAELSEDGNANKTENNRAFVPLPRKNKQLEAEELFRIIIGESPTCSDIPDGIKENIYITIYNQDNISNTLSGKSANHSDDCGVWDSKKGHTVKTKFLVNSDRKLTYVVERQGLLHFQKMFQGKKIYNPIEPQPSADRILTLHRYYTLLKRDTSYKKRVSWFDGEYMKRFGQRQFVAIVEYIGKYPSIDTAHGNAKHSKDAYIRSNPKILNNIKKSVQIQKPTQVYKEMTKLDDSTSFPRNLKQVQNCKQNSQQKQQYRSNVADEILSVISMLNSHDYVAEIIHSRNQGPPVIICYTDHQLTDLRSFLRSQSGVIGIDRTFNLGKCFVTTIVYKSEKVLRKTTGEPPIFLGPLFLHWDGKTNTYHRFFSHLRGIVDLNFDNIEMLIGTDDEKAMINAIDINFPSAKRRLCTKHIKDNIRHYLTDKAPTDVKTRQHIVDKIFGPNGIVCAEDTFDFDERNSVFKTELADHTEFLIYYDKYIKEKLLHYVINSETDELWTNNNAESMNNRIKLACDWKPLKTNDLIEKLYDIVHVQMTDLRRALYGSGNFTLNGKCQRFKISPSVWKSKTEDEKQQYFQKFLKFSMESKPKIITSTNGQYSVKRPQALAKKPNQMKRSRPCKTKKRKL